MKNFLIVGTLSILLLGCGVKVGDPELEHRGDTTAEKLQAEKAKRLGMNASDCIPPESQPVFNTNPTNANLLDTGGMQNMYGVWSMGRYEWQNRWQPSVVGTVNYWKKSTNQSDEIVSYLKHVNHGLKLNKFSNGHKKLNYVFQKTMTDNENHPIHTCHFRIHSSNYKIEKCTSGGGYDCSQFPYLLSFQVDQLELLLAETNTYEKTSSDTLTCEEVLEKAQWDLSCKGRVKTMLIHPSWDDVATKTFSSFTGILGDQTFTLRR